MYTIWCNASLADDALQALQDGVGHHRLLLEAGVANLGAGGESPLLDQADIAFGQPDADQTLRLSSLKWVHITSAGYTRYDRDDIKSTFKTEGRAFTNSSSVFDEPCAQHVLAFMLANARQLPAAFEHQLTDHAWKTEAYRVKSRLIQNQNVLIVGYGAIGKRIAELLAPFKVNIKALRRSVRGDETVPTYPIDMLAELLPDIDHVINVLPANPSSQGIFNMVAFSQMKPGAVFYNIGRGTTVDQTALLAALESGRLGAAYLDVTEPEPLPTDHPLWKAPNCVITPHTAGGFADETMVQVEHFLGNLRRYEAGEPLKDRIF
jgi:phosphoglycerate dehydrogenase-like enzyme